ncbi:MAG: T9SS type A sorting domain-containing protein [Syntrophothermus sp.]
MKKFLFILCFTTLSIITYSQPGRQNNLESIYFLNTNIGWITNYNYYDNFSNIYKTTDGGKSWNQQDYNVDWFNTMMFVNDNIGYMSGIRNTNEDFWKNRKLLKTTDKGRTWEVINDSAKVTQFHFLDEYFAYAIGYSINNNIDIEFKLVKTTDGGITWSLIKELSANTISMWADGKNKISVVDGDLANQKGGISRTTDEGLTWNRIDYVNPINSICYIDSEKGFAAYNGNPHYMNEPGGIFKTTNSGNVWNFEDTTFKSVQRIFFTDSITGFAIYFYSYPEGNSLFKTEDKGITWFSLYSYTPQDSIDKFYFVDNYNGFAIKKNLTTYRTTDGGYTWDQVGQFVTSQEENNLPFQYSIEQNYPNPFNPSTKIKYTLPKQGLVTIKVYDVLGKEVALLVNEEKPSGEYEVEFDGSGLSSGIYFYQIQAGEFFDTKKMMMVK